MRDLEGDSEPTCFQFPGRIFIRKRQVYEMRFAVFKSRFFEPRGFSEESLHASLQVNKKAARSDAVPPSLAQ